MKYYVTINDKRYEVDVEKGKAAILSTTELSSGIVQSAAPSVPSPPMKETAATAAPIAATAPAASEAAPSIKESGDAVKAPMPGGILDIKVSVGSAVKKGDNLMILEAMKMENEITAPRDGIIKRIAVEKGATVALNDILLIIQ